VEKYVTGPWVDYLAELVALLEFEEFEIGEVFDGGVDGFLVMDEVDEIDSYIG
jgi:hypothetical protein